MEIQAVVNALKATTVTGSQGEATDYLKEMSKMIGFSHMLLKLVINENLECAVRQAAVIYLKNLISKSWEVEDESKELPLSEQDKTPLRQNIISAVIRTPDAIRVHLCSCMQSMMRCDFPDRWPNLSMELVQLLHSSNGVELHGALLIIYRLCKIYEYKYQKERLPLIDAMQHILPLLYQRIITLLSDNSQASCLLQKIILKIFFCLIQFTYSTSMISNDEFIDWLKVFVTIIQREVPADCENLGDSPEDTVYWKCKKWAMKIIARVFDKYGSKGQVEDAYIEFAERYSRELAAPIVDAILKNVLEPYVHKHFVSSRVLHLAISHLADAVSHAQIWLIIKPHLQQLLVSVIFPLLTHSAEDEQLWEEDPEEFLRFRFDIFEDLHSPAVSAGQLLQAMSRRVGVLMPTLEFALSKLTAEASPYDVDGALHTISVLAPSLNKNKKFKREVQNLIDAHVIPRISHSVRFVRVRACYAAKSNADAIYTQTKILSRMVQALVERLKDTNEELPVKVEAATAISALLTDQETKIFAMVRPYIRDILMEVLKLISRTHVDDLPQVVEKIIENFEEDVIPVAYDVTCELVNIFYQLTGINTPEGEERLELADDTTVTVMGVLQTMETVLSLVEEHEEIVKRIEPVVRTCVVSIFESFSNNYFDEALSLTQTMISVYVSPEMWPVYDMVCGTFRENEAVLFIDIMPVLHCYLTVDTAAFLSDLNRTQKLLEICEKTLRNSEAGEEAHAHAAKLIEVFILQCMGHVDNYIPAILQLIYERALKPHYNDLYCQLLVVFIAVFYYNADLYMQAMTLLKPEPVNGLEWLAREIIANESNFDGVHNRKMLLYFFCKILTLPLEHLPEAVCNAPKSITMLIISQFNGLQKCMKAAAECNLSDDDSSESSDDEDRMNEELKDSDDDVDEGTLEYLESLKRRNRKKADDANASTTNGDVSTLNGILANALTSTDEDTDTDEDFDCYDMGDVELDEYETSVDAEEGGLNVFTLFNRSFQDVEKNSPLFFQAMIADLGEANTIELKKLLTVCTQQENLEHSKRVAQSGGYIFDTNAPVPQNFKFT